ncbi:C1QL4-like protein [Mya arenaria]|uniref:C1QL4-like protein n=1 Tax=Mya arenaria TaxID=6604 RepID=A0ABY7GA77_MYAAR|nr:C1QL4-like protein [Mya arenaria]
MYSSKQIRELFIILVIKSSLCEINEPRCYSRFDYEEKMLEKMVRTEVKMEELLGKLEELEKGLMNVKTEVDTSTKKIQDQEKKHDTEIEMTKKGIQALEEKYYILQTDLEKFENSTKSSLDALSRNITANMHHSPVAFFATLSSDLGTSFSPKTIVYNNVVTDVGGGYNPGTGVFIAPVDGLYVFSTSVMMILSTSTTYANVRIKKNDSHIVTLVVEDRDGQFETVTGTVILSLQVGDTVMVTSGRYIYGGYTFLSGFKL